MKKTKKRRDFIILTRATVARLRKQQHWGDAVALLVFYEDAAKHQGTNQPWATPEFCRGEKGLHWGKKRFENANRVLREAGLIEKVIGRNKEGRITKWYVRLKYVSTKETEEMVVPESLKSRRLDERPSGPQPTSALSMGTINALNSKGNDSTNEFLITLKKAINSDLLDGTDEDNYTYARLTIEKFTANPSWREILSVLPKVSYWRVRVNSSRDVYKNGVAIWRDGTTSRLPNGQPVPDGYKVLPDGSLFKSYIPKRNPIRTVNDSYDHHPEIDTDQEV